MRAAYGRGTSSNDVHEFAGNEIVAMTAMELLSRYRDGSLSPVEATEAMLGQIRSLDPAVNAYCLVDEETTLEIARASEQRYRNRATLGGLDGVPVAVKDVFLTPMWPTLKGSRTIDPASTLGKRAPCVAALERHGYVPLGKTTTPEFGWKGQSAVWSYQQPVESRENRGRIKRWHRSRRGFGHGAYRPRHRCRRFDTHSSCVLRHCRSQALLWGSAALARQSIRHPGPCRPDDLDG